MHWMPWALTFALASAGKSNPARIAMMAMTTKRSISVKPRNQMGDPPARASLPEMKRRISNNEIYSTNIRLARRGQPAKHHFPIGFFHFSHVSDSQASLDYQWV